MGLPEKPLQWITEYCDLETVMRLRLVCKRLERVVRDGKRLRTTLSVICAEVVRVVSFRVESCFQKEIPDVEGWLQGTTPERDFWLSRLESVVLGGLDIGLTRYSLPMIDMAMLAQNAHEFRMEFPSTVLEALERVGAKSTEFVIVWPMPVTHPKTHKLLDKLEKSDCVKEIKLSLKSKEGKGLTVRDGFEKVNKALWIGPKVTNLEFMFVRPGENPFGWIRVCEDPKLDVIQLKECFPQYILKLERIEEFSAKCPELHYLVLDNVTVSINKDEFLPNSKLTSLAFKKCKPRFGNRVVKCPTITACVFMDCSNITVSDYFSFPKLEELVLWDDHGGPANVKPYLNQLRWLSIIAQKWRSLNILTIPELATSSVSECRVDIHNDNCTPVDINTKTIGGLKKIPRLKELTLMVTNSNPDPIPTVTAEEEKAIKKYFNSLISTREYFEIFKFCYGVHIQKEAESQDKFVWNEQDIYSIKNNI